MRKRVVIITEIIAPYRIPVFNALARRGGLDLHVIFLSETDRSLREWTIPRQEIAFSHEVLPSFRRRVGKYNLLVNRGVTAALRKSMADVLICGGYSYVAAWQALAWSRRNNVPIIVWVESTARDCRRWYAGVEHLKKRFIDVSDAFVVPGRSSADYLMSYGVSPEMIFCAPNAVDTDFFASECLVQHESDPRMPRKFFLFVGRLIQQKGVFDLLAAYEKLAPDVRQEFGLVFAGNGAARSKLEAAASRIHPGSIVFSGFLQRHEMARVYADAYALVFPTHSDPWGLVVNEAIACGLPIIASSAAGCVADLVEDSWNGRIVPEGDADQLAAAMEWLASDPRLRLSMSVNSRQRSRAFSPEACAEGLARAANAMECLIG